MPNYLKAGRWVSNLVNLEVFSAAPVPEPMTYALMLDGLLVLGAAARRRTRRDASAVPQATGA